MLAIWGRRALALTTLGVALATVGASPAAAQSLADDLGPGVDVSRGDETGRVDFIATEPGSPIARPQGISTSDSATDAARAFLADHRGPLGLGGATVERTAVIDGPAEISAVRFQQTQTAIPVLGGEFIVNVDARNRIVSVSGEAEPAVSEHLTPAVNPDEAAETALAVTAKTRDGEPAELRSSDPQLWIYDSRLLGGPGPDRPQLVWRVEVTNGEAGGIRELVLVDATTGDLALHFSQIAEAKNRQICNANNTSSQVPCTSPVRIEGQGATGNVDVDRAYDFSGDTYDFYLSQFGRDNLNGSGGPNPLKSTVKYCDPNESCPFANAFWNGQQMVYGDSYASADDVVGHELTHGYTEFTSGLFYYYQSGAINESISDVMGEFVDLHQHPTAGDTASNRWLMGEDLPIGAIRDMQDPGAFGDPDRMTGPDYKGDPSDSGGVHSNSGVNNKAAFLMTDGGSFNGQTITGLGIVKVARIYDAVETTQLTSASDYANLGAALQQACNNLIGTAGINAADCGQVTKAVTATEMATDPPAAPAPDAPTCTTGSPTNFFFDNMESGSGWTSSPASGGWTYDTTPYATSGVTALYGEDKPSTSDLRMTSPTMSIPAGAFLRFNHAFDFEASFANWDGGVVEYSTNSGTTWNDAGPLIANNGYNGTLDSSNPLGARHAFVDVSHGYMSTRLNLSSLAGQSVKFRFRVASDFSVGSDDGHFGWVVDDVRGYTCATDSTPPQTTITSGPAEGSTTTDNTPTFGFSSSETPSTFQCSVDGGAFTGCTSPKTTPVLPNGAHTFRVRATDASANTDATPATRSFTVAADTAPPQTTITSGPAEGSTIASNTPTFGFGSSETPSTFECRVDGGAFASCTSPHTTAALADGGHTFAVRAIDAAANADPTPATRGFTVDTSGPPPPPPPPSDLTPPETKITKAPPRRTFKRNARFAFESNEPGSTFRCILDGYKQPCASPARAKVGFGRHKLLVQAIDPSGNMDPTAAVARWKVRRR